MKYLLYTILFVLSLSYTLALPLSESKTSTIELLEDEAIIDSSTLEEIEAHLTETIEEYNLIEDEDNFPVQIDRLAQIISTHLQFDHLDAVISSADKEIATEFQHHIQINVQSNYDYMTTNAEEEEESKFLSHNANQYTFQQQLPTLDMMDLEILKSQIFAAIQAHTEGNLPLTWDKFADKLSRQAIESYIQQLLTTVCGKSINDNIVSSSCLHEYAAQLALDLDNYVTDSLAHVFEVLDREALPDLLRHTAEDLRGILTYFNSAFLQNSNRKFVLQVVPWNSDTDNIHGFKSKLLKLAIHPIHDGTEKSHLTAFFIEYAQMARI
ncbi:uncharacterized protein BX663DRAFT_524999 [Cokeromyces recurvatus]|uniref:uncharacterized protein n=1 Tax=Cokeromyces recurvatus TaxID=90255 RepID=UPI00221E3EEE|nr:uncharacterized protein BX663DRAFT_524999 [Cokeromyces recurvatus]KAI7898504.1 hypothetical protein BX663DRAFT_524999 [Cokeromyces recurvatus]